MANETAKSAFEEMQSANTPIVPSKPTALQHSPKTDKAAQRREGVKGVPTTTAIALSSFGLIPDENVREPIPTKMKPTFRALPPPHYTHGSSFHDRLEEAIRKIQAAKIEQECIEQRTKAWVSEVGNENESREAQEASYLHTLRKELSTFGIEAEKVESAIDSLRAHDSRIHSRTKVEYSLLESDESFAHFRGHGSAVRLQCVSILFHIFTRSWGIEKSASKAKNLHDYIATQP